MCHQLLDELYHTPIPKDPTPEEFGLRVIIKDMAYLYHLVAQDYENNFTYSKPYEYQLEPSTPLDISADISALMLMCSKKLPEATNTTLNNLLTHINSLRAQSRYLKALAKKTHYTAQAIWGSNN